MNKLIVISGCSGGGKSTLLSELKNHGYTVMEEVGRKVVKEYGDIDPLLRCELILKKSVDAYYEAKKLKETKNQMVFLDRSFLECVSYYQAINVTTYDHLVKELRYYPIVFMTPPWPEIFCQDEERKHTFEDAVEEYERDLLFYEQSGYHIIELPKIDVRARFQFVISTILKAEKIKS